MDFNEFTVEKRNPLSFGYESSRDEDHDFTLEDIKDEIVEDDITLSEDAVITEVYVKLEDDVKMKDEPRIEESSPLVKEVACCLKFLCQSCDIEYDNVTALINHYVFTHPDSPALQKIRAALSGGLNESNPRPVNESSFKLHCKLCNFECDNLKSLIKHIVSTHHGTADSDKICKYFSGNDKTCQLSGVPLANLNVTDFMEMKKLCDSTFETSSKMTMVRHLKEMPMFSFNSKLMRNICCKECGKSYKEFPNLWRHYRNSHKDKASNFRELVKTYSDNSADRDLRSMISTEYIGNADTLFQQYKISDHQNGINVAKLLNARFKLRDKYRLWCYECKMLYKTPNDLHNHYKITHSELTFNVIDLNEIYYSSYSYDETSIQAYSVKVPCNQCNAYFYKPSFLWRHYIMLHAETNCKYNDVFLRFYLTGFQKKQDVPIELPETHNEQNKVVEDISVVITSSFMHAQMESLLEALRNQTIFGIFCNICNQCYDTSSDLWKHYKENHSKAKLELAIECYECKKDFATAVALWNHYQLYHSELKFMLSNLEEVCSIPYNNNNNNEVENNVENENILKNLIFHRLVVQVPCYDCDRAFNTPSALWSHYCNVHVDKTYKFDDVFIQFYIIN